MKKEGWLGGTFMFIGTLTLMSNVTLTGAVIGPGVISEISFVGILTFVLGAGLLAITEKDN